MQVLSCTVLGCLVHPKTALRQSCAHITNLKRPRGMQIASPPRCWMHSPGHAGVPLVPGAGEVMGHTHELQQVRGGGVP